MKFCNQCGAQLEDEMLFCNVCGAKQEILPVAAETPIETPAEAPAEVPAEAPVEAPAETPAEAPVFVAPAETPAEAPVFVAPVEAPVETPVAPVAPAYYGEPAAPKKSKKGLIIGIISAVVAIAAIVAGVLIFLNMRKDTISAKDIVTIVGYGPDGHGKVAVLIGQKKMMDEAINADDDVNEYPGLWKHLYNSVRDDDENYPAGVGTWIEVNVADAFNTKEKVQNKVWKVLKDDKLSEARNELKKVKITVESEKEDGEYGVGDTIKIKVKYDEDAMKSAHVILKDTTFEYTFTEDDFAPCKEIDPFDGLSVKFEGVSGAGRATVDFDSINAEVKPMFYYSYNYDEFFAAKKNEDKFTLTAEPYGDASKGYLTWENKYYSFDKGALTKVITISGLEEAALINPFEGIKLVYENVSPKLTVKVDASGVNEACRQYVTYTVKNNGNLKCGDDAEISVSVSNKDYLLAQGYLVEDTETYTIKIPESAPHYLIGNEQASYVPDELYHLADKFWACEGGNQLVGGFPGGDEITKINAVDYTDAVLFVGTDGSKFANNVLWQTMEINFDYTYGGQKKNITIYYICKMYDVYIDADGKITSKNTLIDLWADNKPDLIPGEYAAMGEASGITASYSFK